MATLLGFILDLSNAIFDNRFALSRDKRSEYNAKADKIREKLKEQYEIIENGIYDTKLRVDAIEINELKKYLSKKQREKLDDSFFTYKQITSFKEEFSKSHEFFGLSTENKNIILDKINYMRKGMPSK